jgi:hypothetical protein
MQNLNESKQGKERKMVVQLRIREEWSKHRQNTCWFSLSGENVCYNAWTGQKKGGFTMKRHYLAVILFMSLCQTGCAFLGGAAVGSLATGAGYELNAKRQMGKLEDDYKNERISRREYETRKKQIESGSILY